MTTPTDKELRAPAVPLKRERRMHRLHVLFIKLRLFNWRDPEYWLLDVWLQDPYDQMCCNGHECGCRGSTYYGWWQYLLNGWPEHEEDENEETLSVVEELPE